MRNSEDPLLRAIKELQEKTVELSSRSRSFSHDRSHDRSSETTERRPPTTLNLQAANGSCIKTYGFLTLNLNFGLRREFLWRLVIADVDVPIIGSDFLAHYNLLPDCKYKAIVDGITGLRAQGLSKVSQQSSVTAINTTTSNYSDLLSEFQAITRPPGFPREIKHETVHHIRTTPGPPIMSRARRLAPDKLKIAQSEFDDMLRAGTARPSESSWSSPLHLAPKGATGWRPCGDFRALNARTIPDRYPVRHIHDATSFIDGCSIFSKIDLVKAYQQIPVAEEDICKTAIITPFGLFEFPFMTFGLRNAGQTFQRFMDEKWILKPYATRSIAGIFCQLPVSGIASTQVH
ncbi:unnamed protein product [Trichogramma brassicae]|uniref:Reverse transcriptase domain-containing protein n=1 Tax=Trichogramma brassicae TaxID=86971 RepID=A0A6H5I2E4_9HYME|nr:unnamed protein product [Trichogramma brassicae]